MQTYLVVLDHQHSACQMLSTFLVLFTRLQFGAVDSSFVKSNQRTDEERANKIKWIYQATGNTAAKIIIITL